MKRVVRIKAGQSRMGIRTVRYNNPGVVMMLAEGSQVSSDGLNNVHRLCDIPGDKKPRTWRILTAVKPHGGYDGLATRYVLRNTVTGNYTLADLEDMGNLY